MKEYYADANFFLRFLLQDVPDQYLSSKKFLNLAKENKIKIIVPQIVIFEIVFTLDKYYKVTKSEIIEKAKSIILAKYLKVQNREMFRMAIPLFEMSNISLADCFIVAKAKSVQAEVLTFDRNMKKLLSKLA